MKKDRETLAELGISQPMPVEPTTYHLPNILEDQFLLLFCFFHVVVERIRVLPSSRTPLFLPMEAKLPLNTRLTSGPSVQSIKSAGDQQVIGLAFISLHYKMPFHLEETLSRVWLMCERAVFEPMMMMLLEVLRGDKSF